MKLFLSSVIGLLVVASVMATIDPQEAKEMFRGMSQDCKETEKATDADVDTMINEQYPDSKEGKCLVACMQEQFGIVKDKKFQKEAFMGLASIAMGDHEEKMKQADEIAEECKEVAHEDRCEQAILIGKCMEAGAKKRDIKLQ